MLILGTLPTIPAKLALFDLDWTLIRPIKGAIFFPGMPYAWLPNRLPTLLRIAQAGHSIGIITNQNAGGPDVYDRLNSVMKTIDDYLSVSNTSPVFLLAAFSDPPFRKPEIGWKPYLQCSDGSYFVGDASGAIGAWSDMDRVFAQRMDLPFFAPSEVFPHAIPPEIVHQENTLIILMGSPGAGKTTLSKQLVPFGWIVISSDEYRSNRVKIKSVLTKSLSVPNQRVIVDATNPTRDGRQDYLQIGLTRGYSCVIIHHLNAGDFRNALREKPVHKVAELTYWKRLEPPSNEEGVTVYEYLDQF
jgi:bifunctional polynucleotide phosphatase/kinase